MQLSLRGGKTKHFRIRSHGDKNSAPFREIGRPEPKVLFYWGKEMLSKEKIIDVLLTFEVMNPSDDWWLDMAKALIDEAQPEIERVARAQALEDAAKSCEKHMYDCLFDRDIRRHWPDIKLQNDMYADLVRKLKDQENE